MAGLSEGETTINRVQAVKNADGVWMLSWYIKMPDGQLIKKRSQGKTKGAARRNAQQKAEKMIRDFSTGRWSTSDLMVDYLDLVAKPAIMRARRRKRTEDRYLQVLRYMKGECAADHGTQHSFKGQTIGTAREFRSVEKMLDEMEVLHGRETRHQTRTVVSLYVLEQMMRDNLITANPLLGRRLNTVTEVEERPLLVLDFQQWNQVLDHLLSIDPAEGIEAPKRGMYTLADRIARRATVIDLTLLQATTALRVNEASRLRWGKEMVADSHGRLIINVTREISKTKKPRSIGVGDARVEQRLLERGSAIPYGWPVFGSPARPEGLWDKRQRDEAIRNLYDELAEQLDLPYLHERRTHIWRGTLNTMLQELPVAMRAAHLGHSVAVNRSSYTSLADATVLTEHLRTLREVGLMDDDEDEAEPDPQDE